MKKPRAVAILVLCAAALLFLWPASYLASPRWDVVVVDGEGQPVPGVFVRLVYQNHSTEGRSHEITSQADQNGHVLFLPQYRRATLIQRLYYTASSAMAGVHASFGRHAYVLVFGDGYEGIAVTGKYVADWQGFPPSMESRIVVKRR